MFRDRFRKNRRKHVAQASTDRMVLAKLQGDLWIPDKVIFGKTDADRVQPAADIVLKEILGSLRHPLGHPPSLCVREINPKGILPRWSSASRKVCLTSATGIRVMIAVSWSENSSMAIR